MLDVVSVLAIAFIIVLLVIIGLVTMCVYNYNEWTIHNPESCGESECDERIV